MSKQCKTQDSSRYLFISSVVALYQDGRLYLLDLLTCLLFLLVFVSTVKTLNNLRRFVQSPLLLVCQQSKSVSKYVKTLRK